MISRWASCTLFNFAEMERSSDNVQDTFFKKQFVFIDFNFMRRLEIFGLFSFLMASNFEFESFNIICSFKILPFD